jgi:hypothetical protein
MKQFAFVDNENVVTTIIVSESKERLSEIPGGNLGIELPDNHTIKAGDIYNSTDNTFTPVVEESDD